MARILADIRERKSGVPDLILKEGVSVIYGTLPIGDYVLSERVLVERKSLYDFASSIKNKRVFRQLADLRDSCEMPVLILEGGSLSKVRGVKKKGLLGALALITVYYRIPVIFTADRSETAQFLAILARRESMELGEVMSVFNKKKARTKEEKLLRVVESLPDVGPKRARELLRKFGSLRNLFNASYEELLSVPGFGEGRALKLLKFFREETEEI